MDTVAYKILMIVGLIFIFFIIILVADWVWYKVAVEKGKWMKLE